MCRGQMIMYQWSHHATARHGTTDARLLVRVPVLFMNVTIRLETEVLRTVLHSTLELFGRACARLDVTFQFLWTPACRVAVRARHI